MDHTDSNLTPSPLFEVEMELNDNEVQFTPALDFTSPNSFLNVVEDVITDILYQGALIKRVQKQGERSYLSEVEKAQEIVDMRTDVEERVQAVMNQAYEYTLKFEPYTYLWEDDRQEYLNQFLKYGHQLTQEEIEQKNAGEELPEISPTLEQFKEVVSLKVNLSGISLKTLLS